jgi:glycosyltransferase involved in cell wall biosynthesis
MRTKVYVYGLCDVFYDGYYIQGLKEYYNHFEFNLLKFPKFDNGTFAFIIESNNSYKRVIIDSKDSTRININELEWCDVYGKVNYNLDNLFIENQNKIVAIGPSFGIKIWNLLETSYYLGINFIRFRKSILNKREFIANYWRQYKRMYLKEYNSTQSSVNEVFFINSIWKQESQTNKNRALFIDICKSNPNVNFEGGFAARSNGDNLGYDNLVYSKKIPLSIYLRKIKNSAFVFNTPAVLSCHGWKLAEFLALGKAIISTSHYNKLPVDLLDNKHVVYVNTNGRRDIQEVIEKLITDIDFKRELEAESRKYFDEYLSPKKIITRLVENL